MVNVEKSESPERKLPQLGVYEHYKSTPEDEKYYQVLGTAKHTETDEMLVVYVPMYGSLAGDEPQFYVRPLDMFTENVERDGKTVPRFRYIGPAA